MRKNITFKITGGLCLWLINTFILLAGTVTPLFSEVFEIRQECLNNLADCDENIKAVEARVLASNELETVLYYQHVLAEIAFHCGELESCIEQDKKVLIRAKANGFNRVSSCCAMTIGDAYFDLNNLYASLQYYFEGLELLGNKTQNLLYFRLANRIGRTQIQIGEYEEAIKIYKKLAAICVARKDTVNWFYSLNNLARSYMDNGDCAESIITSLKAKKIIDSLPEKEELQVAINLTLGLAYRKNQEYEAAIEQMELALPFISKYEVIDYYLLFHLADCYRAIGNQQKAKKYINEGMPLLEDIAPENLEDIYTILSDYYQSTGNYKAALVAKEKFIAAKLENESGSKVRDVLQLQNKYEVQLKQVEIDKLAQENKNDKLIFNTILFSGLVLFLASIIISYLIFRQRNLKTKAAQVILEQKLLRSQMNPHFIFNSVSVIQSLILNKENRRAAKYLTKFSHLMRLILENSTEKLVSLESELFAIDAYVSLQLIRFNNTFEYELKIPRNIDITQILIPPMLIQPFIENAIEHGIRKVDNGKITLSIFEKEGQLFCEIDDNGVGLLTTKKVELGNKTKSLSTLITKERLQHLGKEMNVPVELNVIDKIGLGIGSSGTKVLMLIPFKI